SKDAKCRGSVKLKHHPFRHLAPPAPMGSRQVRQPRLRGGAGLARLPLEANGGLCGSPGDPSAYRGLKRRWFISPHNPPATVAAINPATMISLSCASTDWWAAADGNVTSEKNRRERTNS